MSNFFNKIAGGINKGVNTVGANSKAMMEKTKVKGQITNLENERRHYIMALGQKIYDNHAQTGELTATDEVTAYIIEITKRLEMIAQQNEELVRIDAELAAATAGVPQPAAPQQPFPFVPQPFNSQPVPPQPVAPATPETSTGAPCACSHINPPGAKFCAGCGTPQA